jgi:hypothetical protein
MSRKRSFGLSRRLARKYRARFSSPAALRAERREAAATKARQRELSNLSRPIIDHTQEIMPP